MLSGTDRSLITAYAAVFCSVVVAAVVTISLLITGSASDHNRKGADTSDAVKFRSARLPVADPKKNAFGRPLVACRQAGMGGLRVNNYHGACVGSKGICLDLTKGRGRNNFFTLTHQPDLTLKAHPCTDNPHHACPIKHWCVGHDAFAEYMNTMGGCDHLVATVICKSTNEHSLTVIPHGAKDEAAIAALECLRYKCHH